MKRWMAGLSLLALGGCSTFAYGMIATFGGLSDHTQDRVPPFVASPRLVGAEWFDDLPQDVQAKIEQIDAARARLSDPAWKPDYYMENVLWSDPGINGPGNCPDESRPAIRIEYTMAGAYRGDSKGCFPWGTGLLEFSNGTVWIGAVTPSGGTSKDQWKQLRSAQPNGFGMLVEPDGRFQIGAARPVKRTYSVYVLPFEMENVVDTPFVPEEARITGSTLSAYYFANGDALRLSRQQGLDQLILDASQVIVQGQASRAARSLTQPYQMGRYISRSESGATTWAAQTPVSADGYRHLFDADAVSRPVSRTKLIERVATVQVSGGTVAPAGAYTVSGAVSSMTDLTTRELLPTPQTVAHYAANAAACGFRPAAPAGWLYWTANCNATPASVDAWSPQGDLRMRFRRGDEGVEMGRVNKDGVISETWTATDYSLAGPYPTPTGTADYNVDGALVYRGAFVGLTPDGPGICGLPKAEQSSQGRFLTEPCTYANGQRVDGLHYARLETQRAEKARADQLAEIERQEDAERRRRIDEGKRQQAELDRQFADMQQRAAQASWASTFQTMNQVATDYAAQARQTQALQQQLAAQQAEQERQRQDAIARQAREAEAQRLRQQQYQQQAMPAPPPASTLPAATYTPPAYVPSSPPNFNTPAPSSPAPATPAAPAQPQLVAMPEGLVLCPMESGFMGSVMCYGPFGNNLVDVTKPVEIAQTCGQSSITPVEYTRIGIVRVYGCGFGIDPTRPRSPNIDSVALLGLSVSQRLVFHCKPGTNYCRAP